MKPKAIRRALLLAAVILASAFGWEWLENGSYPAGETDLSAFASDAAVAVTKEKGRIVFAPREADRGFIFYPGGRVSHQAYAPLMRALAEEGWLCVLLEMPFDLAVLDANAAEGIPALYPQIEMWAIGGHSLGGAIAANHAAGQPDSYDALVLLAAYATKDLSESGLQAVSLYGENDGVLRMDKVEACRGNLPQDSVEIVIPGGNHALFGDYGRQKGDGEASISMQEQLAAVAEAMRGLR